MKFEDRVAIIYGLSALGAAGISYWRGRRGSDLLSDTALHGALVGTGINVAAYFVLDDQEAESLMLNNPEEPSWFGGFQISRKKAKLKKDKFGSLSDEAVRLIGEINPRVLSQHNEAGVTISPVPDNPSIVVQEP